MEQQSFSNGEPTPQSGEFWAQFSEQWQEILAGYALGALEPEEMLAVEEYLQDHPELQATVQHLEETVVGLAYTASAAPAPAAAKAALFARIERSLEMPTAAQLPMARAAAAPNVARPTQPVRPPRLPRRRSPFEGFFNIATGWKIGAIGATAAALFFVVTTVQLLGELQRATAQSVTAGATAAQQQSALDDATNQVARLQAQVAQLQAENEQLLATGQQLIDQFEQNRRQISTLLTVNQLVTLDGTDSAPTARGTLFMGEEAMVLLLEGLQPLPAGQTYQLWLIPADSEPISAGLIEVSNTAAPSLTAESSLPTTTFSAVGLSVEPAGGSLQPTGEIVLLGNRT
jgi:anti-sigma-K factor RskA